MEKKRRKKKYVQLVNQQIHTSCKNHTKETYDREVLHNFQEV